MKMISAEKKHKLKEKAIDETWKLVGIVAYAWVVISLFDLHKMVLLRQLHIHAPLGFKLGLNLVTALVLGKVVLIGDAFHLADRFKDRPTIYPIVFKSGVFAILLVVFQIAEDVIIGIVHGKTIAQSMPQMGGGGVEGPVLVGLMMFVALIPLFAFWEIKRVVGSAELHAMIFEERSSRPPRKSAA